MILTLVIIFLLIMALINRKSKLICTCLFILMLILMGFNYNNADYNMYNVLFIKYGISDILSNTEILFQLLCKLFYNINNKYQFFLVFYSAFGLLLMYITIRKESKNPALVAILYFLFSFFLDSIQIRHFMASAIVCYGLTYLLKDNCTKKDLIRYLMLNIIAIGFHYMAIFYLLFLLVPKLSSKNLKNTLLKIVLPTFIFSIIINSKIFIKLLTLIIPISKVDAYFLSGDWKVNKIATIIIILIQFIPLIILWFSKKYFGNNNTILKKTIIMNILLIIVVPFYFYTVEFGRIFRGIVIIDYIALTNLINKENKQNNLVLLILSILLAVFLFILLIIGMGIYDSTVASILGNNIIFR